MKTTNGKKKRELPQLLKAAETGDLAEVKSVLSSGGDVNLRAEFTMAGYNGATPLTLAAREGHVHVVQFLIESGAALDAEGGLGSPLIEAVSNGHTEVVKCLLANGAQNFGYSLFNAVEQSNVGILELLINSQTDLLQFTSRYGETLLERAISRGKRDIAKLLIEEVPSLCQPAALIAAAESGSIEIVKTLLKCGVDPNTADRDKHYALGTACYYGALDIAKLLIDQGAQLDAIDARGWSCLDWAEYGKRKKVVEWIKSKAKEQCIAVPKQKNTKRMNSTGQP